MNAWDPAPLAPHARALRDYHEGDHHAVMITHSSLGECDELPVAVFFREPDDFFPFERMALELCRGRVLDAGAGTGVHTVALQKRGVEVRAVELLPEAVEIMLERGVRNARCADMFELEGERYDTLLMLMNGIGPVGTLAELDPFLAWAGRLLAPGGQILVDSGEALISEPPPGAPEWEWPEPTADGYPGEAWIRLEYRGEVGAPFRELYADAETLAAHVERGGWRCEFAFTDEAGAYLARLRPPA